MLDGNAKLSRVQREGVQVMTEQREAIRPGIIVIKDGFPETIYPTGDEWILAFALKGCQWAIDIIEEKRQCILDNWINSMQDGGCD